MLSSTTEKNRYQNATKQIDARTCGAKRRKEAVSKSTDLIEPMLKRALASGVRAKYLLMDSWFGMPAIISKARTHLPVICMIKRTPKIHYEFEGQRLSVDAIYKRFRKRPGRAKVLCSALVTMNDGEMARIVFVRNKHKKDWLVLLSTNTKLPECRCCTHLRQTLGYRGILPYGQAALRPGNRMPGQGFRRSHCPYDHCHASLPFFRSGAAPSRRSAYTWSAFPCLLRRSPRSRISGGATADSDAGNAKTARKQACC